VSKLAALKDEHEKAALQDQANVDEIEQRMRRLWREGLEAQAVSVLLTRIDPN
jgi:hypothetical protein